MPAPISARSRRSRELSPVMRPITAPVATPMIAPFEVLFISLPPVYGSVV